MSPEMYTAYATTGFTPEVAFDTRLTKKGNADGVQWTTSNFQITNRRLICVFNTPLEFDRIMINNFQRNGANTDMGVKNVKTTISDDAITDTTYNAAIANSTVLDNSITILEEQISLFEKRIS